MDIAQTKVTVQNRAMLVVILSVIIAVVILRTAWVSDDAYISFRTVDNLANGYGLTWNTGERVQAFTNPLWVFLMTAFYVLTEEVYYTSIAVSLGLTLIAILIASLKVSRSTDGCGLILLAVLFSKAFIDYSTSGLENPLSYLILAAFYFFFLHRKLDTRTFFSLALLAALGGLNRMDTLLLFLPALSMAFWEIRSFRCFGLAVLGFAPLILWEMFSIIYYGFPFPNTYYAKLHSGIPFNERIVQGLLYYLDSLSIDPLTLTTIIVGVVTVILIRSWRTMSLAVGVLLYLIYIVIIGGDFMSGRFFAVPLLASVMLLSQVQVGQGWLMRLIPPAAILLIGLTSPRAPIFSGKEYGRGGEAGINEKGIADERGWYYQSTGLLRIKRGQLMPDHVWTRDGRRVRLRGDSLMTLSCAGFAGFQAGPKVHVYDGFGLAEPLLARLPAADQRTWRIGHFGRVPPWKYLKGLRSGENSIEDSSLALFYDKILLITRGELFDKDRWIAIWKMNTGAYDHLVRAYVDQPRIDVAYIDICEAKAAGTPWDDTTNFLIRPAGIKITLDSLRFSSSFELSVDHNDHYLVVFGRDSVELGCQKVRKHITSLGGLRIDTVEVPLEAHLVGFNYIMVLPESGDDLYSVGHVRLHD